MRRLIEFFFVVILFGVQVSLWPELTDRFVPAWLLALAFAWGFATDRLAGFRLAFAGGLALDLYAQHHFGMFTLAMTLAYGLSFLIARDDEQGLGAQLVVVAVGGIAYELVILTVLQATEGRLPFLANLLTVATLNVVATIVAFLLLSALVNAYLARLGPTHATQGSVRL